MLLKEAAEEPPLPRVVAAVTVVGAHQPLRTVAVVGAHQPLRTVAVVGAHQPLRMAAVAVREAAVYLAAVVPHPRLPAAEMEAHLRLLVAELQRPRLPVTAVLASVVATMVAVASVVATMAAVASVALRATLPDEPPIRSLLRSGKNVRRERRNRLGGRPSPFRKQPLRMKNPGGASLGL